MMGAPTITRSRIPWLAAATLVASVACSSNKGAVSNSSGNSGGTVSTAGSNSTATGGTSSLTVGGTASGGTASGGNATGGLTGSTGGTSAGGTTAAAGATMAGGGGTTASGGNGGAPQQSSNDAGLSQPAALMTLTPAGTCPEFQNGKVTFNPAMGPRDAEVIMDATAATLDGPLIFGWHATGGDPFQAIGWFGQTPINELKAQGGILVAPYREPGTSTRPWYYEPQGPGDGDNDMLLMDEVVACAIQKVGIDKNHIHAYGMSAGGLMTVQVSYRRSSYIASVVSYSGGQVADIPVQDPSNKFAAMVVHGGTTDISSVDGIAYQPASETYVSNLKANGQFAFLCNHNMGHADPATLPNAAEVQASVWQFLQDHPYQTTPDPYANGLPAGFWAGCSL
ncbi:MAG TPA: hypothetical protein VL137_07260 [Polyangiaceae bacterium]|nr:hypothetical protein [Polyangiaceae bacterium]